MHRVRMIMAAVGIAALGLVNCGDDRAAGTADGPQVNPSSDGGTTAPVDPVVASATAMITEGRQTFRFDTFGDEAFWGDTLRIHQTIASSVTPRAALGVGLKVDVDALPADLVAKLRAGQVDLDSPSTTLALLQLGAVVGVKGVFNGSQMTSVGITCAVCH